MTDTREVHTEQRVPADSHFDQKDLSQVEGRIQLPSLKEAVTLSGDSIWFWPPPCDLRSTGLTILYNNTTCILKHYVRSLVTLRPPCWRDCREKWRREEGMPEEPQLLKPSQPKCWICEGAFEKTPAQATF
ncbi:uncharacterized protein LOC116572352 [Mustela erminea]|uniref:uncharacterized protein LOC116572352 n=1 Tax=Mustela erminea TaxID=36723 RepID=UPI001386B2AE|nr:uncharacterized protein LOC116572352 [Mustela erminea]